MARKKVKLQWIVNDTARKATYKKRVKGLMKRLKNSVFYAALAFPSEVERVLAEFKSRPENDQTKKVLNQENFTWQRITKARDELGKQQKKNRKSEIEHLRTQCLSGKRLEGLDSRDLGDLMWAIDDQLEAVKHRMSLVPVAQPQVAGAGGSSSSNAGIGGTIWCSGSGASMGMGMGVSNVGAFAGVGAVLSGIGTFALVLFQMLVVAVSRGRFSSFSSINGAGAGAGVGAGAALGSGAAGSAIGAAQKTSFELAIEALENQIFMEQNQQIQNENMVNVLGDQEMLPLDYDVSNFWRNPYIH
ncbi:hypothetical protein AAG906_019375 [Vitis piasezkii]